MIWLGIDAGNSGAVVALGWDGEKPFVLDESKMKTINIGKMVKVNIIDADWLLDFTYALHSNAGPGGLVYALERSQVIGTEGAKASFTYGRGYGTLYTVGKVLAKAGAQFVEWFPQEWQAKALRSAADDPRVGELLGGTMLTKKDKKATKAQAVVQCMTYLPDLVIKPKGNRTYHTGVCDAGAIGLNAMALFPPLTGGGFCWPARQAPKRSPQATEAPPEPWAETA